MIDGMRIRNSVRLVCTMRLWNGWQCNRAAVAGDTLCAKHGGRPDSETAKKIENAVKRSRGKAKNLIPNNRRMKEQTVDILKNPRRIDPGLLLLEEVERCAGVIAWLENKIGTLEEEGEFLEKKIIEISESKDGGGATGNYTMRRTEVRTEVSAWWKLLQDERSLALRVSTAALRAGVEERRVRLAERSIVALETAITAALSDLGLNPSDERVRSAVGTRLRQVLAAGEPGSSQGASALVPVSAGADAGTPNFPPQRTQRPPRVVDF